MGVYARPALKVCYHTFRHARVTIHATDRNARAHGLALACTQSRWWSRFFVRHALRMQVELVDGLKNGLLVCGMRIKLDEDVTRERIRLHTPHPLYLVQLGLQVLLALS